MKNGAQENILPLGGAGRINIGSVNSLGAILVEDGRLSLADTERIMELQRRDGWRFGEAALRLGLITREDLQKALIRQYGLPSMMSENETASAELVTASMPFHERAEELRALRTQLLIRWFDPRSAKRTLAIVSPGSGEGRSYVAANLAVLFSQIGDRTLLIDADMRNPRLHKIFNVSDRIGLSTLLAGRADRGAMVPAPGFSKLMLLPAGALPPNPVELLSRPSLNSLLEDMQSDFDVILIDTPPAVRYTDAQSVTFRAGNALVLTRKNHTRVADTNRVMRELSDTGARVVGTVMNAF